MSPAGAAGGSGDPGPAPAWLVSPEELEKYSKISREAGEKVLQESIERARLLAQVEEHARLQAARRSELFTGVLALASALHIAATALLGAAHPWAAGVGLYAAGMLAWALLATRDRKRPTEGP